MTPTRVRATFAVAAATAVLLALTSCAPAVNLHHAGGGHHPSASPTPTPTPTPTVSTLDTTAPTPLANIDCAKFVSSAQLTAAFGAGVVSAIQTSAIATGDMQGQDTQIPAMDYVRAAGGVTCLWTNQPANFYYTHPGSGFPPYKEISVSVLFNAQTAWTNEEAVEGEPGDYGDGSCDIGSCELDEYVGGSVWMNATELNQKPTASDPFGAIITQAKAAILAAGVVGADPAPAAGTLPIGNTCSAFVADADASTALGTSVVSTQPVKQQDDLEFYGIWSGAQDELKDHPCVWVHAGKAVGHLSWLAGGAWAWDEAQALTPADGPVQPLAIPGLPDGDTAFIRCSAADASCVADLILGGNWIQAQVSQPGSTNRAAVTAVAAAIVTKVG